MDCQSSEQVATRYPRRPARDSLWRMTSALEDAAAPTTIPWQEDGLAGLLLEPPGRAKAKWLYVFGHGAGAGMHHPFMVAMSAALAARGIATLRWEQPAMTAGRGRPDRPAVVETMARAACEHAHALRPKARLVAGGKSMGGRMTSLAASSAPLPGVEALAFLGFPLHPAGRPASERAAHLAAVGLPMLFVSGTRDALADLALLRAAVAAVAQAELVEIHDGDHGLAVPKRAGIDPIAVAADAIAAFVAALPAKR